MRDDLVARATRFSELNAAGRLLLPNAWDAASARVFEAAGFPAIGTTSAGIAFSRGLLDGEVIGREGMMREVDSIVSAVECPVTVDIEAGYGQAPEEVAETVEAVMKAGGVGVNLEDSRVEEEPLFRIADQVARLSAARSTADRRGIPLVINARTDTFLLSLGEDLEERIALTVERGRAFLAAGADLVFVPVLTEPAVVRRIVDAIGGPVSLMALPGAPAADVLFASGASRVSLGHTAMMAMLGALRDLAKDIRETGAWSSIERTYYGDREAHALFASRK